MGFSPEDVTCIADTIIIWQHENTVDVESLDLEYVILHHQQIPCSFSSYLPKPTSCSIVLHSRFYWRLLDLLRSTHIAERRLGSFCVQTTYTKCRPSPRSLHRPHLFNRSASLRPTQGPSNALYAAQGAYHPLLNEAMMGSYFLTIQ